MKRVTLVCLYLVCILNIAFSFGYQIHNNQLLSTVYGLSDGWNSMKVLDDITKLKYYAVTDASFLGIDYNGISNSRKLSNLVDNLAELGVDTQSINAIDYPSLGMGTHRAYNHQGFDFDYIKEGVANAAKKQARWSRGRQLMIDTVANAYNFDNIKSNIFAREQYYVHMLGDLQKGSARSIKLMGRIGEISGLLDDFAQSNRTFAQSISETNHVQSRIINEYADELSGIARSYTKYTGVTDESRRAAKALMNDELSDVIRRMNDSLDIDILPQIEVSSSNFNFAKNLGGNLGAAAIGTGIFTLYSAFSNGGLGNVSLSEIATIGGIYVASAAADTLITAAVPKVAKIFNLGGLATNGLFIGVTAVVDTAFDSYGYIRDYLNGRSSGWQSARNIGISVGKNALSLGVSLGANAALTSIFGGSAVAAASTAAAVAGPPGWIALAVAGISIGTYAVFNSLADNIIQYFDIQDVKASVVNGSADYAGWVDDYIGY